MFVFASLAESDAVAFRDPIPRDEFERETRLVHHHLRGDESVHNHEISFYVKYGSPPMINQRKRFALGCIRFAVIERLYG